VGDQEGEPSAQVQAGQVVQGLQDAAGLAARQACGQVLQEDPLDLRVQLAQHVEQDLASAHVRFIAQALQDRLEDLGTLGQQGDGGRLGGGVLRRAEVLQKDIDVFLQAGHGHQVQAVHGGPDLL